MSPTLKFISLVSGLALLGEASGAIVYFSGQNIPIPNTFAGVSVDLETGSNTNALNGLPGGDANFFLGGSGFSNDAHNLTVSASLQALRTGTGNTDAIINVPFDTTIDVSSEFYSTGFGASGQTNPHMGTASGFTDNVAGYLGFSLIIDDPNNAGNPLTVYGWARVTLRDGNGEGTLHEWAYEDTGAGITAGAVPEPRSLALLALGCLRLLFRRRCA